MRLIRMTMIGLIAMGAVFAQPAAWADAADVYLRKGNQLYEQATRGKALNEGKLKEAIEAYQEALRRNPKALIKYNLGTAQARLRQYQDAQQTLSEATESPDVSVKNNSNFNLGVAIGKPVIDQMQSPHSGAQPEMEKNLKKLEDSMKAFRNVIVDAPDDIDAIYNYEVAKKAYDSLKQKQQQENQDQKNGKGDKQGDKSQNQGKQQQGQQGKQDNQQGQQQKQDQQGQGQQQQNQQGQKQDQKQDQKQGEQNQQGKQDQKNEQKQGQDPKQGQGQDQQDQQGNGGLEEQKREQEKGNKPESSGAQSAGGEGERASKPMNPDQMDAMRLLNLLEKERPQQYKRLFQFRGDSDRRLQKDW